MGKMSVRRKLAIVSWKAPKEGNIYGKLTVDATKALEYIQHIRETTGHKVTITHFVGKAVAQALEQTPSLNGRIRFGKFVPHDSVDIAYLVSLEEGQNLAKAKIRNADQKSMVEIAQELREMAKKLRAGKDDDFEKSKGTLRAMPTWLLRPLVHTIGYLASILGVEIKAMGIERFPMGSCIITSVGMFGLDEGYAPPTPWAHVPLYVLVGAIRENPVVQDGQIVAQSQLTITATIDHRFIDGFQGGVLARVVREVFENPWSLDGLDGPSDASKAE